MPGEHLDFIMRLLETDPKLSPVKLKLEARIP
jgi:hypothetical protein